MDRLTRGEVFAVRRLYPHCSRVRYFARRNAYYGLADWERVREYPGPTWGFLGFAADLRAELTASAAIGGNQP